jgi:ribonuclease BN (tRNA processing enzyme)
LNSVKPFYLSSQTVIPIKSNRSTYQVKSFYLSSQTVLPFKFNSRHYSEGGGKNQNDRGGNEGGIVVRAAPLRHPVPCFGYVIDEPDQNGRMDVEKATALGLPPGKEYKYLKEGQSVQTKDGAWIHPEDVLGPNRPGWGAAG